MTRTWYIKQDLLNLSLGQGIFIIRPASESGHTMSRIPLFLQRFIGLMGAGGSVGSVVGTGFVVVGMGLVGFSVGLVSTVLMVLLFVVDELGVGDNVETVVVEGNVVVASVVVVTVVEVVVVTGIGSSTKRGHIKAD